MEDFDEEPEKEQVQDTDDFEPVRDVKGERVDETPQGEGSASSFVPDFDISYHLGTELEEADEEADDKEGEEHNERESDDHPAILRIDESLLARVNQVFVEPPHYRQSQQEQLERIIGSYVFIIHGDEHAGKLTCALYLAQDLLRRKGVEERIYCYRRRPDESSSLLDFVRQDHVKSDRVYKGRIVVYFLDLGPKPSKPAKFWQRNLA